MNANPPPAPGTYVDLIPNDRGDLRLTLTALGVEDAEMFRIEKARKGTLYALILLLEDHLERDWELVAPKEIAALTSAPILGTGIDRDDQGKLVTVEHLYWFTDYAVRDEVEELLAQGGITFDRAPAEPDADMPHLIG